MNIALIIALPQEAEGIDEYPVYLSGCGKVNATIATMTAIRDGADCIINYGTAGTVSEQSGLLEVTGFVDRDMDATPLNFKLGQTPYEKDIMLGTPEVVCGTGDTFATAKPKIDCDIVDMEAYAIAKICKKHKVEFLCYKYISDSADESASSDWEQNVAKGCKQFKEQVLDKLSQPMMT